MATQRAVPGANLPESRTSTARTSRGGTDFGQIPDVTTELPGEAGFGSASDTPTSGFGDAGGFGTAGTTTAAPGESVSERAARDFPRAAGVIDQVKQQASTRVNEQKARAAEGLGSVASAIRQASEQLRSENQTLATYADKAVDQIQLFADRMRDKDPAEMMRDAEQFARRNPTAFIGGAFVLGLALARFLKSSSDTDFGGRDIHRDSDFGDTGFNRGYGSYGSGSSVGSGGRVGSTPGISS
jgi:hypothetical protein